MKCEQVSLLGISPGKLYRHGACIYQKRMFVFGGKKGVSENSNDIYFYDFEEKLWAHIFIDVNKPKPPKLDSFSLNLDKTHENIIVFGGFYGKFTNRLFFFFLKENRWEEIAAKGVCPAKRAGHSSVLHNDTHLYISGGGNFKQKFNDLWCLEIIKSVWIQIAVNERIYQVNCFISI